MSREELKRLLENMLTIEVSVTYSAGYGDSQNVEVSILLDGKAVSSSKSTIVFPEASNDK
ncbi:hypothetical protein ABE527_04965 [Brucella sp. TWI432]